MKCFVTIALFACVSLVRAEPTLQIPQNQYLPPNPNQGTVQQPSNNYLPPTQTYQTPSNNYLPPQRNYQAPAPGVTGAIFKAQNGGGAGGYGSGNGYGQRDEESYGPAKYEFKYDVQDYESGNDFGHMESRDGDLAIGTYYVLLPDGRKQIVEYEADQNGYRPTIRYEQVGNGENAGRNSGYDNNAQSKFGGYQ